MKKSIIFLFTVLMVTICFAQETKDVIKFMGIPVDGTKSAMIQKLKSKGFTYDTKTDTFKGEFNGQDALISLQTVNGKVWRVQVTTPLLFNGYNETHVKINFNRLCQQFEQNPKYVSFQTESQEIGDEEDISYEISVKSKQYEAVYLQDGDKMKFVWFTIYTFLDYYYIIIFYENSYNEANGEDL